MNSTNRSRLKEDTAQKELDLCHGLWSVVFFACVGGTDPMNHKKSSSLSVLLMRDICCQLSCFGYKFCHFSLKVKIAKMKDCVIKLMLSSNQTPVNRQAALPKPMASQMFYSINRSKPVRRLYVL